MQVNEVVVNGVKELSLVNDTVSEDTLIEGTTAHDASGKQITGKVVVTPVDSELNAESENAIQNKAVVAGINNAVNGVKEYANGIISNPNLLINPDFSINQRGQTVYSGFGYTVDGWFNQAFYVETTVLDKGVRITYYNAETAINWIYHTVESLKAGTYTLSVKIRKSRPDLSVRCYEGYTTASTDWQTIQTPINMSSDGSLTFTLATTDSGLASGDWIEIEWAKLELGSVATPFVKPNPAVELMKCQRYYIPAPLVGLPSSMNANTVYFFIPLPVAMRVNPSLQNVELVVLNRNNNARLDLADWTTSIYTSLKNGVLIAITKTGHNLNVNDYVAQLVSGGLSAEL
jgi:hypothetical protein